jgi:signal transduction histidine kinase/response regulator of citrate/malate metabolism
MLPAPPHIAWLCFRLRAGIGALPPTTLELLMAAEAEFLTLIEDEPDAASAPHPMRWKVAVIDDDPAVHDGTRFALQDYTLHGRGLELLSARSAAEARDLLRRHPDAAVILLDVVMETEGAGLELVEYVRDELKNETVRIILRTGQPGQAPERRIVVDYDINDYKAKTELTADKLFTTLTAALRSYEQLQRLVETRRGLEIIIDAAATLFDHRSLKRLAEGVLTQLSSLMAIECVGILVLREEISEGEHGISVLAGSGCYSDLAATDSSRSLDEDIHRLIVEAFQKRCHDFSAGRYILYIGTGSGRELVVLLEAEKQLSDTDKALVEVFCSRLAAAFDNVTLYERLERANLDLEDKVERRTAELVAAKQQLESQSARLRRANSFKGEVLGTVAHDLKNPLGVILGRTEMLTEFLSSTPVPEESARAQVEHIRQSARRLTAMVNDLIADAMADALDISVRTDAVDLAELARDVAEANRGPAARKDQRITMAAEPDLWVTGDLERLREAVDNLVSNAVKYSPVGGEIAIAADRDGQEAFIRVTDSGPGLSPEDTSRLFGRFQRLSAKPTAGESSTGLGLSIAKRIIDLHKGRIFVEDIRPGGGATFAIALPLKEGAHS